MCRSKKYPWPVHPLNTRAVIDDVKHEVGHDGAKYKVFHIREAAKRYVCLKCGGSIDVGETHEVAWMENTVPGSQFGVDPRRHWHTLY